MWRLLYQKPKKANHSDATGFDIIPNPRLLPLFLYYLSLRGTKQSQRLSDCFVPRNDGGLVMILNPDLGAGDIY